jgi:hypothetical protein
MCEVFKLLYELIQLVCSEDFQKIFALLTLIIIYVEIKITNTDLINSQGEYPETLL